jgi:methylmalonyl-CoA/ethylmalonyl-CoA epimerase
MIKRIDHIGIAVADLDKQIRFYSEVLGLTCSGVEEVEDQNVKVAMFPVGEIRIELLQPTSANSPIAKFLEKRGEGIHHIAYLVTDLEQELQRLEEQQVQLIDPQSRIGAGGYKIAFLHPKSTFGVLIEMCEQLEKEVGNSRA